MILRSAFIYSTKLWAILSHPLLLPQWSYSSPPPCRHNIFKFPFHMSDLALYKSYPQFSFMPLSWAKTICLETMICINVFKFLDCSHPLSVLSMWVFWGLEEDYLMNYAPSYTTGVYFVWNLHTLKPYRDNPPTPGMSVGLYFLTVKREEQHLTLPLLLMGSYGKFLGKRSSLPLWNDYNCTQAKLSCWKSWAVRVEALFPSSYCK